MDLKQIIIDVFNPKKGEIFIILNDFPVKQELVNEDFIQRRDFSKEWFTALQELSKQFQFSVEQVITFEPTGENGRPLPEKAFQNNKEIDLNMKLDSLSENHIVLALTRYSATGPLGTRARKQKFRCASMPQVRKDMSAFDVDHKILAKKCAILKDRLTWAKGAEVIFSTGHKCYFDLRSRNAIADNGKCHNPGIIINLPSGESFICPYEGKEELGESLTNGEISADLQGDIVIYHVKKGKITDVKGFPENKKAEELRSFFSEDPARRYIAEFAFGCNDKAVLIGNILQDEKIGFHWAYGYNRYLGGNIGVEDFRNKSTVVHQDNVYAKGMKVTVKQAKLFYEEGEEIIIQDSEYAKGLFGN